MDADILIKNLPSLDFSHEVQVNLIKTKVG
jgi:hypothetical protein